MTHSFFIMYDGHPIKKMPIKNFKKLNALKNEQKPKKCFLIISFIYVDMFTICCMAFLAFIILEFLNNLCR